MLGASDNLDLVINVFKDGINGSYRTVPKQVSNAVAAPDLSSVWQFTFGKRQKGIAFPFFQDSTVFMSRVIAICVQTGARK
jgi:hypothetical protein